METWLMYDNVCIYAIELDWIDLHGISGWVLHDMILDCDWDGRIYSADRRM